MKKFLFWLFTILFVSAVLASSVRGVFGNPTEETLNNKEFTQNGPMELSPERGRFALTYSIVENKSFQFSIPVARFALPDLGYKDGKYVSLFAPGVSFIAIPGYLAGKNFNIAQVGAFLTVSLFALFNFILVVKIATRLGVSQSAATIGAILFLFASPGFAYSATLYQHQISTFLILAALYLLINYKSFLSLFLVWMLTALSIPVDYPNLFLMFPIGIFAIVKNITFARTEKFLNLSIKVKSILAVVGVVLPFLFFAWFNYHSYGNPLQFSGTVPGVDAMDEAGNPIPLEGTSAEISEEYTNPDLQQKSALEFFKARDLLNGFFIHLFSPDRGILVFSPVLLTGIIGLYILYKKRRMEAGLLISIAAINLVFYSLRGDPWGGWAFGSRYLIPAYAILGIGSAFFIEKYIGKIFIALAFFVLFAYSLVVGVSGALTTSAIPPKIQVAALEAITGKKEHYNFLRGIEMIKDNKSKSFVFQSEGYKYLTAWQYLAVLYGAVYLFAIINICSLLFEKLKK